MTIKEPDEMREAWDKIAPGYDKTNTPTQMWLANEGLRRAGLRQGMRFLDVAAGSGALSIPSARNGARVLATDRSSVMLNLLDQRARNEGLERRVFSLNRRGFRFMQFRDSLRLEVICDDEGLFP